MSMKKVIPFPQKEKIDEQAASWIVLLDRGEPSAEQRQALKAWLSADARHREAFKEMAQLWGDLECLHILEELFPRQASPAPNPVRKWIPAAGLAAMLVAGLFFALGTDRFGAGPNPGASQAQASELVYETQTGQQAKILLEDGSQLMLNTQSEARVRFSTEERAIYLTQGEAHFEVAPNPGQPFVVYAGNGRVQAVGTAFNVRLADGGVEVLVNEGTVEVTAENDLRAAASPAGSSATLRERGVARYNDSVTDLTTLSVEKIEQRLAWRQQKWMFEGETLAEVLDEVSRYSDRQIIIADPILSDIKVGGYFDMGDVEGLLGALEAGFGIQVARQGDAFLLQAQKGLKLIE